jgi:hypothetical protein
MCGSVGECKAEATACPAISVHRGRTAARERLLLTDIKRYDVDANRIRVTEAGEEPGA